MLAGFDGNGRLGAGQIPPQGSRAFRVRRVRDAAAGENRQRATQCAAREPTASGALHNQDGKISWYVL